MCMSYLEVVVCVYGYLTWRVVYTYIIMCIYHVGYTYTHYRYNRHMYIPSSRGHTQVYMMYVYGFALCGMYVHGG